MWRCPRTNSENVIQERQRYDRERRAPWHRWYGLACWKRLVEVTLHNPDHVICEWMENGIRCNRPTDDIDHIVPHKGSWSLFMDPKNLQGLCHRHHSMKTAREDGGFGNHKAS